ncbi:hypothetical protein Q9251_08200 [Alkalihalobacillus macyae]|uniref:hypothetical protein n=1 Tax=Guptibacillus hwajinpoensis TaxID=208199 RepID=UPI00273C876E|nr:hypothetical protein [Alkalihalobacillus macyae]MDP4550864.1 hypothetical protein [Alkalihalobacillus macyae]
MKMLISESGIIQFEGDEEVVSKAMGKDLSTVDLSNYRRDSDSLSFLYDKTKARGDIQSAKNYLAAKNAFIKRSALGRIVETQSEFDTLSNALLRGSVDHVRVKSIEARRPLFEHLEGNAELGEIATVMLTLLDAVKALDETFHSQSQKDALVSSVREIFEQVNTLKSNL